jgi:hypothetical protein
VGTPDASAIVMMIETNHRADQAHDLRSLVACGDGACGHGDAQGLVEIARLLALCLAPPVRQELLTVARLAEHDLDAAGEVWWPLTRRVREMLDRRPMRGSCSPWRS